MSLELNNSETDMKPASPAVKLPSSMLLHGLFQSLGLKINRGKLTKIVESLGEQVDVEISDRIKTILKQSRIENAQVGQFNFQRFNLSRLPALVVHNERWFVAESRESSDKIFLRDEQGVSTAVDIDQLADAKVLFIRLPKKRAQGESNESSLSAIKLVKKELFAKKRWVLDVSLATIVVNVLAIATSLFAMQTYDRVVPTLAYATLTTMIVGMLIVVALDWVLKMVRGYIMDKVASDVDERVSQRVYEHVLNLRLDKRPRSLGTLSAQISGLDSVRQFLGSAAIFGLIDLPFVFLFIFFISVIGGPISYVYLALLPIALILGLVIQITLRKITKQALIRSNERQGILVDSIKGSEAIRAVNAGWRFADEWKEVTRSINAYSMKQKTYSNLGTSTTGSLSTLAYIAAIAVGVTQIEQGELTMGALIACSILGGRVIAPVARGVQQLVQWQQITQTLEMVDQVLALPSDRGEGRDLLIPEKAPDKLAVEGVEFSYGESPVLQLKVPALSFKPGDRVVVMGPIGGGKSTLLKVLAGIYKPSSGRVLLGEGDIWELDAGVISEQIAYLPQSVGLFKGTLQSNLSLSGAVNDSDLLEICSQLGVDAIAADSGVSLGLEISEGGEGISDGQKQLVALARLLLARPKVWILDEPTASMDPETEQCALDVILNRVQPEDIVVVSTHRPMLAAKFASRVLVVRKGQIIEDGPPDVVIPKLMGRRPVQSRNPGAGFKPQGGTNVI